MNTQNTNNTNEAVYVDTVMQDFRTSLFIVSALVNVTLFVTWLAVKLS